jgi:hypothetical protein
MNTPLTIAPRNLSNATIFETIPDKILKSTTPKPGSALAPGSAPMQEFSKGGKTFKIDDIVKYSLKDATPTVAYGKIVSISSHREKTGEAVFKVIHSDTKSAAPKKFVFTDDTSLALVGKATPLSVEPVRFADLPFKTGMFIQYSITSGKPSPAVGKITNIRRDTHDDTKLLLIVEHANNTSKIIPMTHTPTPEILVESKGKKIELTVAPVKTMTTPNGEILKIGDKVLCEYEKGHVEVIITDFNFTPHSFAILGKLSNGTDVSIPLKNVQRKQNGGSKKYTEDENKYRLKYAKYKAKYLLLK